MEACSGLATSTSVMTGPYTRPRNRAWLAATQVEALVIPRFRSSSAASRCPLTLSSCFSLPVAAKHIFYIQMLHFCRQPLPLHAVQLLQLACKATVSFCNILV